MSSQNWSPFSFYSMSSPAFRECYDEWSMPMVSHIRAAASRMRGADISIGSLSKDLLSSPAGVPALRAPKPSSKPSRISKAIPRPILQSEPIRRPSRATPGQRCLVARKIRQQLIALSSQTRCKTHRQGPLLSCGVPTGAFDLFHDVRHVLTLKSFTGQRSKTLEPPR